MTVKGTFHQGDLNIFLGESTGKQCIGNCVVATIYAAIVPLVQWNKKGLDGILHAANRLYMNIPKHLLVTDIQSTVTEY